MKREITACAILLAILVLSLINIRFIDDKTQSLIGDVVLAEKLADAGKSEEAAKQIESSLKRWRALHLYTRIMFRQSEEDIITEAYFEVLSELDDADSSPSAFAMLTEQLKRLADMEHITPESIF
ncbi:MAG: DUF4363 family protein [Oscillospiraceae bacterium]